MIKDIYIKETKNKGKGVFALKDFKKGDIIFRSSKGKIVKEREISKLSREDQNHLDQIDKGLFEVQSSPVRYINHSCDPNAISKGRVIFSLKRIKIGEEITTDYRTGALNEGWKLKCLCGSKNCTGIVYGDFFTLNKTLQKKYLLFAPKYINQEYRRRNATFA